MNFVEELRWRGMLHTVMPGTEEMLKSEMLNNSIVSGYIGFDPTADSLHVGHLTQIMTLIHFQNAGHKPYALVGGATGMVGDPSGKSLERNLLSTDDLNHNLKSLKLQLQQFIDFKTNKINCAVMVNNYDWFRKFTFLDFIRDVGKHITVNYMMAKDSVKKRVKGDNGMSFTEFTYQLVQGYDFYYLRKHYDCKIQMGGSDQWGNIVTGTELIRRKDAGEAYGLTTKLIKKADGTKFGKTENGSIWLDPKRTKPFDFYQFWLNISDADSRTYIKIFTLLDKKSILKLEKKHRLAPNLRILQKELAKDVTKRVHGESIMNLVSITVDFAFNKDFKWNDLFKIPQRQFLSIFYSTNKFFTTKYHYPNFGEDDNIVNFLCELQNYDDENNYKYMFESKNEAKKLILNGGVYINKVKIDLNVKVSKLDWFKRKYIYVQKGKKNAALVVLCKDVVAEMKKFRTLSKNISEVF